MNSKNANPRDAIIDLSATELAQRIRSGKLSSKEVVEAYIKRIESVNEKLNAVVIKLFEDARAQATEADKKLKSGSKVGPLHGVPITIKEQFEVKGTETSVGVPTQTGRISGTDGPLVNRLRRAGAIILGKTNIPMSLYGWEADNPVYGRTKNPWDLKRTSGGSSGGEASIISARGSPVGIGSDFGGSIRIPCHFSGIHGFKPTSQRLTVSDTPAHLFSSGQNALFPVAGPMARSVADLKLIMRVLADPPLTGVPDLTPPVPWSDPDKISIKKLNIGIYTEIGLFTISPAIKRAVEESAEALRKKGADVRSFKPFDMKEAYLLYLAIVASGGKESVPRTLKGTPPSKFIEPVIKVTTIPGFIRKMVANRIEKKGDKLLAEAIREMKIRTSEDYWKLIEKFNDYRWKFIKVMDDEQIDAIICPPFATVAPQHGGIDGMGPSPGIYVFPYNTTGMPAGVVSVTRVRKGEEIAEKRRSIRNPAEEAALLVEKGSTGMPVGVLVVARQWRDDVVLKIMETLEEHFKGKPDYPPNLRPPF